MKRLVDLIILFLLPWLISTQNISLSELQNYPDEINSSVFVASPGLSQSSSSAATDRNQDLVNQGTPSDNLYFLLIADPPKIAWINPSKQNTALKSSRASIKATVKSSSAITSVNVYLNDVLYGEPEMNPSTTEIGSFILTKTLNLMPGENSIYLVATDANGTTTSEKRYFTFFISENTPDTSVVTGPLFESRITWVSPSKPNTSLRSAVTTIRAKVKSGSVISSVQLYLNDVLYGEPDMEPSTTEVGGFDLSKTVNLEPGENSIYIVAKDNKGTMTSEKRFLTIPLQENISGTITAPQTTTPQSTKDPLITWVTPSRQNSILRSTRTSIKATVKSSSNISSVLLYLNDVLYGEPEMNPSENEIGSFTLSKNINFEPGENSVYIIAKSDAGTTTSEKMVLIAPAIERADSLAIIASRLASVEWNIPSLKSTTLKSSSTNIAASIKSTSKPTSAVLYLNGISLGETEVKQSPTDPAVYIFEKSINFKQIENNIYLSVKNQAGETRSESRVFICPPSSLMANQPSNQDAARSGITVPPAQPVVSEAAPPETDNNVQSRQQVASQVTVINPAPTPPVITWTSPSGLRTNLDIFNATVKAKIKTGSALKSVLLYMNGISKGEVDLRSIPEEPGTYQIEKNVNFGPGENTIYLVATNNEGSVKSEERYFINPSAVPPAIAWSNPGTPNSLANTESLMVSACIKSSTELKSVKLLVNGNILSEDNVFQLSSSGDCNYNWQSTVVLREGDNSIFIIAANAAGSTTSEKRLIKMQTASTEKRLALIIGNSRYKNSAPLKNPANDANLMEGTLKNLGFQVIKRLDAGKDDMLSAIREFEDKLPDYNVALFYYAGHGNQVDGKNYLIPTDAKLEKPSDCKFEAIQVDLIVEEFERYQDNTNIVILDACRNNPFASWARGGEAGFKMMTFTSGTIVAYATSEGTTAADGKGDNGLYTEELVKQMLVPQPISSVFMNTRVQVRKLSNNAQVPSEVNKLNGDFFFKK
jgi:hypothetical protein